VSGRAAAGMPTYSRKLFTIVPPALDKPLFMWYIVSMKATNDIIDLTFIVAISAALIIRLITL
jgi:hypothetical protein